MKEILENTKGRIWSIGLLCGAHFRFTCYSELHVIFRGLKKCIDQALLMYRKNVGSPKK